MCEPLHSQCLLGRMEAMKGTERQTTRARAFLLFVLPLNDTRSLDTATLSQASMSRCATRQTHSCVPLYHCQVSSNRTHRSKQEKSIGGASYRCVVHTETTGPWSALTTGSESSGGLRWGHVLRVIGAVYFLLASIVRNNCVEYHPSIHRWTIWFAGADVADLTVDSQTCRKPYCRHYR
jgi:hypothetical protein